MKKSPNFTARIESPDFSFERGDWLKCSRLKIAIDVAGKGGLGSVSGCVVECAPMANGKLELRVWIGNRYYRKQFTVYEGLIDWSLIDGRTVSEQDKQLNKAKVKQARTLLKKKTRKRTIRVNFRGEAGERNERKGEGSLLPPKAPNPEVGRASVSGSGEGQSGSSCQGIGPEADEGSS